VDPDNSKRWSQVDFNNLDLIGTIAEVQSPGNPTLINLVNDVATLGALSFLKLNQTTQQVTVGTFKFPIVATPQIKTDSDTPTDFTLVTGAEKTLVLDSVVWDDLRVPAQNTKLNPTKSEPNFEIFTDGLYVYKFSTTNDDDESVHFIAQMPHTYKEGSDICPHVHWSPDSTNTGNVRWQLEYVIVNINGTFAGAATSDTITEAADGVALKHQLAEFTTIDGTGLTISHIIICRLTRMSSSDGLDTFTGNACFFEFDFHYQKDTQGSRTESAK